jgi:drug/metabolite transporter (DMT)-like permease
VVVVFSLVSALGYGLSDFVGGMIAKRVSPWSVTAVAQAASALIMAATTLLVDGSPTGADLAWGVVAGSGSGLGAVFLYRGLAGGPMSVVAPLSAVGAALLPVIVGVATGERPSTLTWLGVGCAFPAIWLVSRVTEEHAPNVTRPVSAGVVDGLLAGAGFGLLFIALGQVPESAGLLPLTLTQSTSVVAVVVTATAFRQPWVPRDPYVLRAVAAGVLGTTATLAFLLATQTGLLTVAAVLSSLYPATTVLLAAVVLRERIGRVQAIGLVLAVLAVALVAAG